MRIFRYIPPDVIESNVHVITVIEYVDKQEIHMTAKEMERLDEIRKWNIFVNIHESCIRLLRGNSTSYNRSFRFTEKNSKCI